MATILITGGARGIGLALTRAYLAAGDRVIVAVRKPDDAARNAPQAEAIVLDVADDGSAARMAETLAGQAVDVLINNAGIIGPEQQTSARMDFAGFLDTLNVNTLGPLRVTQALLPNLRLAAAPKVAIISSRMGSLGYTKSTQVAYRASKAAVNKVAQCLATDLAQDGIAVISLHPGWVRTEMGSASADIGVEESAAGIKRVIDDLTLAGTGRFLNYDGAEIPW